MRKEAFIFEEFSAKVIEELRSGKPLTGPDEVFTPLLKKILKASLESELDEQLDQSRNSDKNRRTGKNLQSSLGVFEICTPRDRNCTFEPRKVGKVSEHSPTNPHNHIYLLISTHIIYILSMVLLISAQDLSIFRSLLAQPAPHIPFQQDKIFINPCHPRSIHPPLCALFIIPHPHILPQYFFPIFANLIPELSPSMKIFTHLFLVFIYFTASAQHAVQRCGSDEMLHHNIQQYPGYEQAYRQTFEDAKQNSPAGKTNTLYRIPVVVHIVYKTPAQNLHDSLIYSQIEILNRDYRRQNTDTLKTRNVFKPVAADAGIEFYLAGTDPDGIPTTGIIRKQTSRTSFGDLFNIATIDRVKADTAGGSSGWDPSRYFNIWVCNLDVFNSPFILGIARPPIGAPNWDSTLFNFPPAHDGVVVAYQVFGRNNPNATGPLTATAQGRTTTHEVGHYLGLRHIWGDGNQFTNNGCSVDDGIVDTPNAKNSQSQTCDTTSNSCTDAPVDFPDMIENYMEYSEDNCMNMFTAGQMDIMRAILATTRSGLMQSAASIASRPVNNHNMVRLFPNPARQSFQIQTSPEIRSISEIRITDSLGRIVYNDSSGSTARAIDMSAASQGIYFVKIASDKGTYINKLVVE